MVLNDNLTVTETGASTWTLSFGTASSITGVGKSLTMSGSNGTLVLSGTGSYTGGTFVNAGTLVLASNTAFPDGTSLTVGAGGTVSFDSSQATASPISLSAAPASSPSLSGEAVPEPGTVALLLAGLAVGGFAAWRRGRRGLRA